MVYHATVIYFCSTKKYRIFLKNGCRNKAETPHDDSSNIDEVIRSVLNMFFFFQDNISQVQKIIQGTKKH